MEESVLGMTTLPVSGEVECSSQAILVAPLFYRALQENLQKVLLLGDQNYDEVLTLSTEAPEELTWWQNRIPSVEWEDSDRPDSDTVR